jgi:hypothetical protein
MGLNNRSWNDDHVQNLLHILFGDNIAKQQELENLLIETVAPIMQNNVESMKKLVSNTKYLQNRKRLAEFTKIDLGFQTKVKPKI